MEKEMEEKINELMNKLQIEIGKMITELCRIRKEGGNNKNLHQIKNVELKGGSSRRKE